MCSVEYECQTNHSSLGELHFHQFPAGAVLETRVE